MVLDKLINHYKDCEIDIIVQKEMCEKVKELYSNVNIFTINNGFFNYNNFMSDKKICDNLLIKKYDDICIPLSTKNIVGCEELELIASKMKKKAVYIFTADYKFHKRISNFKNIKLIKYIKYLIEIFINFLDFICKSICMYTCIYYTKFRWRKK